MNSTIKILKLIAIVAILIFSGCADDGEPGPQGPKGDKGDQGDQGIQGEQGEPGTANVMYSNWLEIDWNVSDGSTFKSMSIEESELTVDFFDDGGVLLFFIKGFQGSAQIVIQLPLIQGNLNLYGGVILTSVSGSIRLVAASLDGTAISLSPGDYQWRYVLIPGGVSLNGGRSAAIDFSDYEAVKRHYGIPD